jgi:hypothetical protein
MSKNKFSWILYIGYIFVFVVAVDYFIYCAVIRDFIPQMDDRKLTVLERNVGCQMYWDRNNLFKDFSFEKKAGVTRIGCFGDSYTAGDGAGKGYDYPNFLQKLFDDNGYNVEVLNFGLGGDSFSQTFILWQEYNKKYNLDYVTFGPAGIWPERDKTFDLWGHGVYLLDGRMSKEWAFKSMHGRFILKNGEPCFVEVSGDTEREKITRYMAFAPPWRYWRYDQYAPYCLSAPLLAIAPRRYIKNPFYYTDNQDESRILYDKLLSAMDNGSENFSFLSWQVAAGEAASLSIPDSMNFSKIIALWSFPYVSMDNHHSPQGYNLIAKQNFDYLTGKKEGNYNMFSFAWGSGKTATALQRRPLCDYERATLELGGTDVGYFNDITHNACSDPNIDIKCAIDSKALLAFQSGDNAADSLFLPLDFVPDAGVVLRVFSAEGSADISMGNIRYLDGSLVGIAPFLPGMEVRHSGCQMLLKRYFYRKATAAKLLIGGREVMHSKPDDHDDFIMVPAKGNLKVLVAINTRFVDIDKLPDTGDVFLKLYKHDGSFDKYLFMRYGKLALNVRFDHPIKKPIAKMKSE